TRVEPDPRRYARPPGLPGVGAGGHQSGRCPRGAGVPGADSRAEGSRAADGADLRATAGGPRAPPRGDASAAEVDRGAGAVASGRAPDHTRSPIMKTLRKEAATMPGQNELDQLCINTIRTLSMDAVQAA